MGKGINIEFVSDVRRFLGGTKDVSKALDDVSDSLDGLARDAARSGEKLGDELTDGADAGADAARDLERKFKDTLDTVRDDSRKAGDDLGRHIKDGTDDASSGFDDVKDEAKDSAREVAASFDGSMDGVVGGVQELAANLGGLGPVGAAAGLAAAAGAGAMYEAWRTNAELAEERVSSMYDDMLESGNNYLSESYVMSEVGKIVQGLEGATTSLGTVREIVDSTGLDMGTVLRAFSGDASAYEKVMVALTYKEQEQVEALDSGRFATAELRQELEGAAAAQGRATEAVTLAREAQTASAESLRDYQAALAGVDDIVTDTNNTILENSKTWAGNEEQLRTENLAALADMAGRLDGVNQAAKDAGLTGSELTVVQQQQYDAFMKAATGAGLSEDAARDLAAQYGLIPPNVTTGFSTPGLDQAMDKARDYAAMLDGISPTKTVTFEGRVLGSARIVGINPATGEPIYGAAYASGGYVDGEGSGTDDSVPARLSRGEYVLDAQATQRLGVGRLDQANLGQGRPAQPAPQVVQGPSEVNLSEDSVNRLAEALARVSERIGNGVLTDYVDHLSKMGRGPILPRPPRR